MMKIVIDDIFAKIDKVESNSHYYYSKMVELYKDNKRLNNKRLNNLGHSLADMLNVEARRIDILEAEIKKLNEYISDCDIQRYTADQDLSGRIKALENKNLNSNSTKSYQESMQDMDFVDNSNEAICPKCYNRFKITCRN